MGVVLTIVLAMQMLSAVVMIGLVLIQHGKGADMGAAFGSGGSGSLFGASGSANFMSRATSVLAGVFFCSTLALAYFGGPRPDAGAGSVLMGAKLPGAAASAPLLGSSSAATQIPGNTSPTMQPPAQAASSALSAASGAVAIPGK